MALKIPEMVQETTITAGLGTYSLQGAITNFRSFDQELSAFGPVLTLYTVFDTAAEPVYEINLGTWTTGSPPTLTRAQLLKSSTGQPINWPGGSVVKNVVAGLPGVIMEGILDPSNGGLVKQVGGLLLTTPASAGGLNLVSQSDYAAMRNLLSLRVAPDANPQVQAWDADLDVLATLSKTANYAILGNGTIWTSAPISAAIVTHSSTSPVTANNVQDALIQLTHAYAAHDKTTSQSITTTSEFEITDLTSLSIPGNGNDSKVYRCTGAVVLSGWSNLSHYYVRVRVGANGDKNDALKGLTVWGGIDASGPISIAIPSRPFIPSAGHKVTVTFEASVTGASIMTTSGYSFVNIEQISNA